jgi:hypothetical protein
MTRDASLPAAAARRTSPTSSWVMSLPTPLELPMSLHECHSGAAGSFGAARSHRRFALRQKFPFVRPRRARRPNPARLPSDRGSPAAVSAFARFVFVTHRSTCTIPETSSSRPRLGQHTDNGDRTGPKGRSHKSLFLTSGIGDHACHRSDRLLQPIWSSADIGRPDLDFGHLAHPDQSHHTIRLTTEIVSQLSSGIPRDLFSAAPGW